MFVRFFQYFGEQTDDFVDKSHLLLLIDGILHTGKHSFE